MKKLCISHSSASCLASLAFTARIFSGITMDLPHLGNSAWISAVLGTLIALPIPLMLTLICKHTQSTSALCVLPEKMHRFAAAILALILCFDAAVSATFIVSSASYAALDSITTFYLLLPLFALCAWCLSFNGNSIGSSARIWSRILAGITLIIVLIIIPDYRPSWLTPVFGNGYSSILNGAMRIAGWESLIFIVFLISEPGSACNGHPNLMKPLLTGTACTILLLLAHGMLCPVLIKQEAGSRFARLDTLLANGRLSLSFQMPLLILWFIGLFYQILYDAFTCAAMIQHLFPKLKKSVCIFIAVSSLAVLTLTPYTRRTGNLSAAPLAFLITGIVVVLCAVCILHEKGGSENAKTNPSASV